MIIFPHIYFSFHHFSFTSQSVWEYKYNSSKKISAHLLKNTITLKLNLMTRIFLRDQRTWKSYLRNAPILFKTTVDITSFDSMVPSARKITKCIGEYVIKEAKSDKGMGTGERTSHNGYRGIVSASFVY